MKSLEERRAELVALLGEDKIKSMEDLFDDYFIYGIRTERPLIGLFDSGTTPSVTPDISNPPEQRMTEIRDRFHATSEYSNPPKTALSDFGTSDSVTPEYSKTPRLH